MFRVVIPTVLSWMLGTTSVALAQTTPEVSATFPAAKWEERAPRDVGLAVEKLEALRDLVGGRGVVVRQGYQVYSWGDVGQSGDIASAVKPVISTLLLLAVQEGKLKSVDEPVAAFEPRLKSLNDGKDAGITWRQLASQTSGYGLTDKPGAAYAYNDFARALYYRVLTEQVFQERGADLFRTRLATTLQLQDDYAFDRGKPGRLSISVRDLARFGLLYLHGGKWRDKQLLRPDLVQLALGSPLAAATPRSAGRDAPMLPDQTSLGGGKNQTPTGPGFYSFNWWLNGVDHAGRRLWVDAPPDCFVAAGHGGRRMLWVFPSAELIVAWNDSPIADHDVSPGDAMTKCNQAARLIREACGPQRRTRVTLDKTKWQINGAATHPGTPAAGLLMNVRMVNAVFEDRRKRDFDPAANTERLIAKIPDYAAHGVRAFTLCLQGGMPGYEGAVNSAFEPDGSLRGDYLRRVRRVIEACDRHGVVVILGCYYQRQDQILRDEAAVRAGVVNVAQWIKGCGFTNVALEIANEYPHTGFDRKLLRSPPGQAELLRLAKATAPELLVSTSGIGDGKLDEAVIAASDYLLIHFNGVRVAEIPARVKALERHGKPIVCNEDDKQGTAAVAALDATIAAGASYGLMLEKHNQHHPFHYNGPADDPLFYARLKTLTHR